jgi:hypothetical protein
MSFKSKVFAAAATLTLVGGAAGTLAAGPANAATPSCGHRCVNPFSKKFSDVLTTKPGFVLDVFRQGAKVGQPIILFQSSNADPAEDFTVSLEGHVSDFLAAGLVSPALALRYGSDPTPKNPHARDNWALEIEYSPNGVDSGLCVGISNLVAAPANNTRVSLQACGVSARTVWVTDRQNIQRGGVFTFPFVPLINGADTNFSHPYVLTYPQNGNPTDKPRPQLVTQTLHQFSRGQVYDNQQWSAFFGVLR